MKHDRRIDIIALGRRFLVARAHRRLILGAMALLYLGLTALNVALFYDRASPPPPPPPAAYAKDALAALDFVSGLRMTADPSGHAPAPATAVALTITEANQVAAKHSTAAILMGELATVPARAELAGLKWQLHREGFRITSVENCDFRASKEHKRLLALLANPPDLVFASPVDPIANRDLYRKLGARSHLVLLNAAPGQLVTGQPFAAAVVGDSVGAGVASGHLIGLALRGSGKIGVIRFASDPFFNPGKLAASALAHPPQSVLDDRYSGLIQALQGNYPQIQIVAETRIRGPDYARQAKAAVISMLAAHPDLSAIWVNWGGAASRALQALQSARHHRRVRLATFDLDQSLAIGLARRRVLGVATDRTYSIGATAAQVGALVILKKRPPQFVEEPTLPVTHSTLRSAWEDAYNAALPHKLTAARP